MGRFWEFSSPTGEFQNLPIDSADVEINGLVGDACNNKKHHGGPMKAICVLENEILTKITIRRPPNQSRHYWRKHACRRIQSDDWFNIRGM